ncbi:LCP family protein [Anaerovorax odorimutans]|uniref:LCP family protein n=1 Tax=Anaerovorax odorimutans TaxID=109327 RepID=UPI0003F74C97|nr:LCP family protein [Anaerovorax odorimutans]
MNMKIFIKTFIVAFVIFLVIMTPANYALNKAGDVRVFSGEENLMRDMDYVVDKNSQFFEQFSESERVNVLLMGINGHMTDTIMLGSYDMKNQRVDIISIPRDTYFPKEGATTPASKKINAIYGRDGAVGTAEAVSDLLMGMPINYYAVIKYEGVSNIVESIGGVPVNIPFDMDYDDPRDKPPLSIHFKEGPTTLDGKDAVRFLRYRKDDKKGYGYTQGDVGRVEAQQNFVKSAFKEALGLKLPKVAATVMKNVDSDLPLGMATRIATKALGLKSEDLKAWTVEGESGTRNNLSYWFADNDKIEAMLMKIYGSSEDETKDKTEEK